MEPRIHVITLAVRDLDRALEFYRKGLWEVSWCPDRKGERS
jgi:catechol 2,3-dioxygenase-like lactoylglutathione lyase family enzyme